MIATHEAEAIRRVEPLMGTTVSVDIRAPLVSPDVIDDVFDQLRDIEARFSTYRPDSEISRLARDEVREEDCSLDVRHVLAACDHLVIVFPLWCGDMPALLKGYIERLLQPDLIARQNSENAMDWHIFQNKTARIVMTMGMPVTIYRWFYRGHALKLLKRNILHFIGIKPVRHTLYGMIGTSKPEQRERWLAEMRELGKAAQ
jgi:putative NADPH-quinone reductase